MKIENLIKGSNPDVQKTGSNVVTGKDAIKDRRQLSAAVGDKIDISNEPQTVTSLVGIVERAPDVRLEKVEQTREALKTQRYTVTSEQVAEKIMEEVSV